MTTREKIKVMQAYVDGERIQYRLENDEEWLDYHGEPLWNWDVFTYRIKLENSLRPYNNGEEFMSALREHGPAILQKATVNRWLFLKMVFDDGVFFGFNSPNMKYTFKELLNKHYQWQDGTPCGVLVE